jgi:post-segregation antitoxin (ccd killing protein)
MKVYGTVDVWIRVVLTSELVAANKSTNINICVLVYTSLSEALRRRAKAYGMAAMEETQVYE